MKNQTQIMAEAMNSLQIGQFFLMDAPDVEKKFLIMRITKDLFIPKL